MGPCLIVTDEGLTPLRPAILYGIDSRAGEEIVELTGEFGEERIFADCGKVLSSQAVGPKLRWISKHEPEVFQRSRLWFSLSSYLMAKLTGEYVLDTTQPASVIRSMIWPEPTGTTSARLRLLSICRCPSWLGRWRSSDELRRERPRSPVSRQGWRCVLAR